MCLMDWDGWNDLASGNLFRLPKILVFFYLLKFKYKITIPKRIAKNRIFKIKILSWIFKNIFSEEFFHKVQYATHVLFKLNDV